MSSVPHYAAIPASDSAFYHNITVSGGPAPVRAYIAELLPDVLEGRIQPGRVFDRVIGIDEVPDGYRAMDRFLKRKVPDRSVDYIQRLIQSRRVETPQQNERSTTWKQNFDQRVKHQQARGQRI